MTFLLFFSLSPPRRVSSERPRTVRERPRKTDGEHDLDVKQLRCAFAPRFVPFARELVRAFPSPESLEEMFGGLMGHPLS
jgi:hypothetical protein